MICVVSAGLEQFKLSLGMMQNPNNPAPQNGGSVMRVIPDYHLYDGLGLAGLVAKKEVTPLELAEEAIYRIEAYNPVINAVIYKMYDQARSQAKAKQIGRAHV